MLRFQQIMSSIPKADKGTYFGGSGMDEFGEAEELKAPPMQQLNEFDENQLFPDFDESKFFPNKFTALDKKDLKGLYKAHVVSKQETFPFLKKRMIENQKKTLEYFQEGINRNSCRMILMALTNFQAHNLIITDEHLECARKKRKKVFELLKKSQETIVGHLIKTLDPIDVLKILLNYHTVPTSVVMNLICNHREFGTVFDVVDNAENGNTVLHELIVEKNISGVKLWLSTLFAGQCQKDIPFDIEKKNKSGKTVLQLALESGIHDIISAVLVYGNPSFISVNEEQLANAGILFAQIRKEQHDLNQIKMRKLAERQQVMSTVQEQTERHVGILAYQQGVMGQGLMTVAQAVDHNHAEISELRENVSLAFTDERQRLLTQPATLMIAARVEVLTQEIEMQKEQNNYLMGLVKTLLIECQESKRENAEIRALLQEARPQVALPAPTSPASQNRNHLFAITNIQEVPPLAGQQKEKDSGQGLTSSPRRQMNGAGTPY